MTNKELIEQLVFQLGTVESLMEEVGRLNRENGHLELKLQEARECLEKVFSPPCATDVLACSLSHTWVGFCETCAGVGKTISGERWDGDTLKEEA